MNLEEGLFSKKIKIWYYNPRESILRDNKGKVIGYMDSNGRFSMTNLKVPQIFLSREDVPFSLKWQVVERKVTEKEFNEKYKKYVRGPLSEDYMPLLEDALNEYELENHKGSIREVSKPKIID